MLLKLARGILGILGCACICTGQCIYGTPENFKTKIEFEVQHFKEGLRIEFFEWLWKNRRLDRGFPLYIGFSDLILIGRSSK